MNKEMNKKKGKAEKKLDEIEHLAEIREQQRKQALSAERGEKLAPFVDNVKAKEKLNKKNIHKAS